jgi:hypothetical protein
MMVVIQCAASKRADAGRLRTASGKPVDFVADPLAAPSDPRRVYARPDDLSDTGRSWRQILLKYNGTKQDNPLGLFPAYQLYENKIYGRLADRFGIQKLYILSAGWGLIRADFLTPYYDITFSQSAEVYKRRKKTDRYADFCMVPIATDDDIVFFGGKNYLSLFCSLTADIRSKKTVFYNSSSAPQLKGCVVKRFETTMRTNWQYNCANAFVDGEIRLE